jgi:diguanylate cyclase (GGDEF)-like protein
MPTAEFFKAQLQCMNAIATLNPDEMLEKVTKQLEAGPTYDHIGIGVLDYSTREVVVVAEAGQRRGTLGERIPLGAGLLGYVARNGHVAACRPTSPSNSALRPLLVDSAVAIALPVFYSDQLHGILYVESSTPTDFSEEEVLLLHMLADLIAGALHNALSFQKAVEQAKQAEKDHLTGVHSRLFFMDALSTECRKAGKSGSHFAVVMIDLDHLKSVNDTLGHLDGDSVLIRVGNVLLRVSSQECIVARFGGDEFLILVRSGTTDSTMELAEELRRGILQDTFLAERHITGSIGLAVFPENGADPESLLKAADSAMYESKRRGGNAVTIGRK